MQELNNKSNEELIRKYRLAGKIRFISFSLLFFFLLLMKAVGGYSYLNVAAISLIFAEAILNQPYNFFLKRVNIYRFQYYQMITDIIVISWTLYYMGGMEVPIISMAYYAVILWAGVVSTTQAVFFAVTASALFFSSTVILNHFGILPFISYLHYKMPTAQMFSLVLGNISFMFAFGYFSAHSSKVIKFLERKRQEESLKHTHKLLAAGYLVSGIAHDIINHLVSIRGYARILLERIGEGKDENKKLSTIEGLERIEELERKSTELLSKLSQFSRKPKEELAPTDLNKVIEDALGLTFPLARMSDVTAEKMLESDLPLIMADKDQLQEVLVALILNSLDAISKKGKITLKTHYEKTSDYVEVVLSDTGKGIKPGYLSRIAAPFFTTKSTEKTLGLGLTIAFGIVERYGGKINVESTEGKGSTFTIQLPVR